MAIIGTAQEAPDSPQASFELGKYVITRRFKVQTDSVNDGPLTVVLAPGIPPLFSTYQFGAETNPFCRVRSVVPERIKPASLWWIVTVTYETPDRKGASGSDSLGGDSSSGDSSGGSGGGTVEENDQQFTNPLAEYPEIAIHFETTKEPLYGMQAVGVNANVTNGSSQVLIANSPFYAVGDQVYLYYGNKSLLTTITAINVGMKTSSITIQNPWPGASTTKAVFMDLNYQPVRSSALQIYVPPPMYDVSRLVLTITRNENILNNIVATSLLYQDSVNSDVFWGTNPGQAKIQSITAQRQTKQLPTGTTFPFLRVTYVIHFKPTWDIQLLDKGTYFNYQKSQDTPVRKTAFTSDDYQTIIEGLLDGNGGKLPAGANPVFLTVRPYNWVPFGPLNLPQGFLSGVS